MSGSFAERQLARVDPARLLRVAPSPAAGGRSFVELCRAALGEPIGAAPLEELASQASSIAVLISDESRDEPRAEMLEAIFERCAPKKASIFVAAGTHAEASAEVVPEAYRSRNITVHDATALEWMRDLGRTARGTRVRLHQDVALAELVVVTSRIRPHYFAGFSGGTKSIFPGAALAEDALANHLLKSDPSARLGRVDDNVCRLDMEEAALKLSSAVFGLMVLSDIDGTPIAASAGHPIAAHRALIGHARELFGVVAPRSPVVVVADVPPVSRSLYQACKMIPPAAALLEPGGTVIVVAECDRGIGPIDRVNDGIYRLGILPQLPDEHRVVLVSSLGPETVRASFAEPASSLSAALDEACARHGVDRAVLLWRAGECIARAGQPLPEAAPRATFGA